MQPLERAHKLYQMSLQEGPEGELASEMLAKHIVKHNITENELKDEVDPNWTPQREQQFVRPNLLPHEWRMMEALRTPKKISEMESCFPNVEEGKRNSRVRNSLRKLTDLRFAGRVKRGVYCLTQEGREFIEVS